jgi:hypothetical protein
VRSPTEIAFRLRQEAANLRLFLHPPRCTAAVSPLPLPAPAAIAARLRGTAFAAKLVKIAEDILAQRIPLLGFEVRPDREIHWRRDYVHGCETGPVYFRRIPYLDFNRAGDHKIIWELNRHQHLVTLAQASLLEERADFLEEVFRQLEFWLDQNPVCAGINWAGALEVAFRALSWLWIQHLAADRMPPQLASRWLRALYHHGCYLEHNLSIYFSPNTHLQGEALALHALGLAFGVERWRTRGGAIMRRLMEEHVHADGGHFEQSSYYHLYATDMFLFHAVLEPAPEAFREKLRRMARYLWAFAGSGELPFFGDDDGGRLFYPFGERREFARATLAACAAFLGDSPCHGEARDLEEIAVWWLGEHTAVPQRASRASAFFPDTGVVTMAEQDTEIIVSARAFGPGRAGHSHADALHFTLRHAGKEVLLDPGTYTYVADPLWRNRFRGTPAHNTVCVDGLDQADASGPFRWSNPPATEILHHQANPWQFHALCSYRGVCHERQMIFSEGALWVVDRVHGTGKHRVEQFWHPTEPVERLDDGSIQLAGGMRLIVSEGPAVAIETGGEYGWRSPVPGIKLPSPVIRVKVEAELPCVMAAVFDSRGGAALCLEGDWLTLGDRRVHLRSRTNRKN